MKAAGIVAEYNPFHNGHALHLKKTREAGCGPVAVVMSGICTQRGEPALFPKDIRCAAALRAGADLVVELPLCWATRSAEGFARGAVSLLRALGCVSVLSFGSESGDAEAIAGYAARVAALDGGEALRARLKTGASFPRAREEALLREFPGEKLPEGPNDLLAAEYLRAAGELGAAFEPLAVRRVGVAHDARAAHDAGAVHDVETPENGLASASAVRSMLENGEWERACGFVPGFAAGMYESARAAGRAPLRLPLFETLLLARLRTFSPEEFAEAGDVGEGLENRLYSAVREAGSYAELLALVKTKRYPMARIRRALLSAFFGTGKAERDALPPYLRVLGLNGRGAEMLRAAKKEGDLPVVTEYAQIKKLGKRANDVFALECRAADLCALCLPAPGPCGSEQRYRPIVFR